MQPSPGLNEPNHKTLAQDLIAAKAEEEFARQRRINAEEALLPFLDQEPNASRTTDFDFAKFTVRLSTGYLFDRDRLESALEKHGDMLPIKTKVELDTKRIAELQEKNPRLFNQIAIDLGITESPRKPNITVKVIND